MNIKTPKSYPLRILLFFAVLVVVYFFFEVLGFIINNNYYLTVLTFIAINTILALGINLITGVTGQLNLGHAAFMSIGAYAGAISTMRYDLPFGVAIVVAGLVAA